MRTSFERSAIRTMLTIVVASAVALTGSLRTADATFKGPNGLLAYQERVGDHYQLFSVEPDGTGRRQLTHFDDSDATNAQWSPDGTKIAFLRRWGANKERLYTMNADGGGLHELAKQLRGVPAWLRDGKHLLVIKALKWTIVNADGTGARFAGIPGSGDSPAFLPDGKKVAFIASVGRQDGLAAIFVAQIGGGPKAQRRVSPWQKFGDKIDVSPDGSTILFTKHPAPDASRVYSIHVDGTGLHQLAHVSSGNVNTGLDSWSPDGKKIAIASERDGVSRIYITNANGLGMTRVSGDGEAHLASWGTHP
jgi:Tol biopolymer transport system component